MLLFSTAAGYNGLKLNTNVASATMIGDHTLTVNNSSAKFCTEKKLKASWLETLQTGTVHAGNMTARLYSGWLKPLRTSFVPVRASVISVRWDIGTEPKMIL